MPQVTQAVSNKQTKDPLAKRNEFELLSLLRGLKRDHVCLCVGSYSIEGLTRMSEIVGENGRIVLLEPNHDRLSDLQKDLRPLSNIIYTHQAFNDSKLPDASVDFVLSAFNFEFQPPKELDESFEEFWRVTRTGGLITAAELDHSHLNHYPLAEHLEMNLREIAAKAQREKLWDPYVGRKLFGIFQELGFSDLQMDVQAHHLTYGESRKEDLAEWQARLKQIENWIETGEIEVSFQFESFRSELLSFFKNPNRVSYSPVVIGRGVKAR